MVTGFVTSGGLLDIVSGVEFSVLGPLELSERGEVLTLRRGLPRALLVFLLLHRRVPVPADVLADRLWSGEPPLDAANAVQRVVSYVRRSLGPRGHELLLTGPAGYALAVEDGALDSVRFERLVGAAVELGGQHRAAAAVRAVHEVEEALKLWRAEPLSDVRRYDWAAGEIARLEELHVQAQAVRLDALLLLDRLDEAVREARVLVIRHPLQEQFHARLMLALYRSGRQSEALAAYAAARRLLDEELGLDPGPELQTLESRVLNQDAGLEWRPPPDWTTSAAASTTAGAAAVPVPLTSLVGRQQVLSDLRQWLAATSLLTLTGPGGVGKTRLAAELARDWSQESLCWVDLAVVVSPGLVAPQGVDDHGDVLVAAMSVAPAVFVDVDHSHTVEAGRVLEQDPATLLENRRVRGGPGDVEVVSDPGHGEVLTHNGLQRPPRPAARQLRPQRRRFAGVLAPHAPTVSAAVAADRNQQRRRAPAGRLVRQLAHHAVASLALTPHRRHHASGSTT